MTGGMHVTGEAGVTLLKLTGGERVVMTLVTNDTVS